MSGTKAIRSCIGEVYLVSCVRTPLGRFKGALKEVSDSRLGAIVIDSVLQRSAIDKSSVDHVLIESNETAMRDMLSYAGLPDTTKYSIVCGFNGLKSIALAIDLLTRGLNVTVCGGSSTWSEQNLSKGIHMIKESSNNTDNEDRRQYYLSNAVKKVKNAKKNALILEEIQPILIPGHPRLKRSPVDLKQDEAEENYSTQLDTIPLVDGAAACLLSTKDFLKEMNVSPLGKVVSFIEAPSIILSIFSILDENNLEISDIHQWQINDVFFNQYNKTVSELGIAEDIVNVHGGTSVMGFNTGMSGLHDIVHLIHSLKPNQKGIIVHGTHESAISILIEKVPIESKFITSENKPVATLYTKDPCPLCDELKVELAPYLERVQLKEIYLTPESYFYKLYRYEIPVLFLGGRFVCRNKLDIQMFEKLLGDVEDFLNH